MNFASMAMVKNSSMLIATMWTLLCAAFCFACQQGCVGAHLFVSMSFEVGMEFHGSQLRCSSCSVYVALQFSMCAVVLFCSVKSFLVPYEDFFVFVGFEEVGTCYTEVLDLHFHGGCYGNIVRTFVRSAMYIAVLRVIMYVGGHSSFSDEASGCIFGAVLSRLYLYVIFVGSISFR